MPYARAGWQVQLLGGWQAALRSLWLSSCARACMVTCPNTDSIVCTLWYASSACAGDFHVPHVEWQWSAVWQVDWVGNGCF